MSYARPVRLEKPVKEHYRKCKGWRRQNGRPVYMVRMTEAEVRGRRSLICFSCTVATAMIALALWVVSMV